MSAVRTIAVWCPDWPVVAAAAAAGLRPNHPVAVLAANKVVACSAAARADNVRRGLRRREAQSRCPELVLVTEDPDRDARAFEPVVCAVESLVPGVEVIRPGLVVLEARGPARYFGDEFQVAERLIDVVAAETGVECQVGIADGIFAATLAAHRGLAVEAGASSKFLASLPVTELCQPSDPGSRDRAELVELLRRLGLRTLGAFAALPVRDVASRFGAAAVRAHRLARGEEERPIGKRLPPADLTVVQRFDPPIERVDAVAFAAREPAARLHDLLAARGLASSRLLVHAQTDQGEELSRVWRCAEPLTPTGIADRVRWQLDAWLTGHAMRWQLGPSGEPGSRGRVRWQVGEGETGEAPALPTGGIVLLRLVPEEITPIGALQRGLWSDRDDGGCGRPGAGGLSGGGGSGGGIELVGDDEEADERAGRAMVRVQGLLGPEAVLTGVLGGGRDPAQAVTLVPWGDELVAQRPGEAPWPGRIPAPFPATVPVDQPRVEVLDEDGKGVGVNGRGVLSEVPRRVVSGEGPRDVLAWAGPWPVEERWWDRGGERRRARLQVLLGADETGHCALLLSCERSRWHIEGVYD